MTNKILIIFYLTITLIFFAGTILSFYDLSYLGYYTDKIINWIWLGFTFTIVFRFWKKKLVKIYSFTLITLVVLSIIPMFIPFFGIVHYFTTIADYQQIKLNSEYRIERTKQNPLSMQRINIYERNGILEKNICRPNYYQIVDEILNIDSLNSIDIDSVTIKDAKIVRINKDEIEIEYQILDKKKSLNNKLNTNDGYKKKDD